MENKITNINESLISPEEVVNNIINNLVGPFKALRSMKSHQDEVKKKGFSALFSFEFKFKVCKYLVTQKEWESIMGTNPSFEQGPNYPIVNITHEEALQFIEKINAIAQSKGYTFSLPTSNMQLEWPGGYQKKFARSYVCSVNYALKRLGKNERSDKFIMAAWLNPIYDKVWCSNNSEGKLHNVGEKEAVKGIYDACGLVYEMRDSAETQSYSGGAFDEDLTYCCDRAYLGFKKSEKKSPKERYNNLGLRLVCVMD